MTDHRIPLGAVADCLRYHRAVLARRLAIRKAWRVECGLDSPIGLSDTILAGIMAMADCITYNSYQQALSEPSHAKA